MFVSVCLLADVETLYHIFVLYYIVFMLYI